MKALQMEAWQTFSAKQKWDVMVSLRGPDITKRWLKLITTAVIRARMRGVMKALDMRVGGAVAYTASAIILPSDNPYGEHFALTSPFDYNHFLYHIRDSAKVLSIPILRLPDDCYGKAINAGLIDGAKILAKGLGRLPSPKRLQMMDYVMDYAGIEDYTNDDNGEDDD